MEKLPGSAKGASNIVYIYWEQGPRNRIRYAVQSLSLQNLQKCCLGLPYRIFNFHVNKIWLKFKLMTLWLKICGVIDFHDLSRNFINSGSVSFLSQFNVKLSRVVYLITIKIKIYKKKVIDKISVIIKSKVVTNK